ncbi:MAG: mechanosensitive ion channel family protein, partial [Pseudomonadota bacterium]|nr:mechanosensitive ion channel family protein [Pseudomonadota bacterium]
YCDVSQMAEVVADIRSMLENHEEIDTDQTLIVNFVAFNASSLDIMVYTFTKTTQWVKFHEVKQDVLLKISEIIEGYGAEVAFPTRTLHLPEGVRLASDASKEGKRKGQSDADAVEGDEDRADDDQNRSTGSKTRSSAQATHKGDVEETGDAE